MGEAPSLQGAQLGLDSLPQPRHDQSPLPQITHKKYKVRSPGWGPRELPPEGSCPQRGDLLWAEAQAEQCLGSASAAALTEPHHFIDEEQASETRVPASHRAATWQNPMSESRCCGGLSWWGHMWPVLETQGQGVTSCLKRLQSLWERAWLTAFPQCDLGHEDMTLGMLLNLCKPAFPHL